MTHPAGVDPVGQPLQEEDASIALFYGQNKMKKPVYGIGINDADYVVNPKINGKSQLCPYYRAWHSMFLRCYSDKSQLRQPTYIGCTVCEEWHSFMAFRDWMQQQDWQGKQLDKDILIAGNKIYSPDTCLFVSLPINMLITDRGAARGDAPLGVNWHIGIKKFQARCSVSGKTKWLGRFSDAHNAHRAWQKYKIEVIKQAAAGQEDMRLVAALNRIAAKVQSDFDLNIETTSYGDIK